MLLVETAHSHEKTKALDGAVEVGLALEDRSVNVNEESSHLAVAGAEIATGHRAFSGHSDLPVDTRNARFSQAVPALSRKPRIRRRSLFGKVHARSNVGLLRGRGEKRKASW